MDSTSLKYVYYDVDVVCIGATKNFVEWVLMSGYCDKIISTKKESWIFKV